MNKNIDAVLTTSAERQLQEYIESVLQSIPQIAGESGFTPQFMEFYQSIIRGIVTGDTGVLYNISEKALTEREFADMYASQIGFDLQDLIESTNPKFRGLSIEVNPDRLKELHRSLIGGSRILGYRLKNGEFEGINTNETSFTLLNTEIFYTYKDGEFKLISHFTPFIKEQL